MKITHELLSKLEPSCSQFVQFCELWPNGAEPTEENLLQVWGMRLDIFHLVRLLPREGQGSRRAFALWCAQQVVHLTDDQRVHNCLAVVERRVQDPDSVSDEELWRAATAARAAAYAADTAADAVYYAADAAADAKRICADFKLHN